MNIYLAGPMRGRPDLNRPAFEAGGKRLRDAGHTVFVPGAAGNGDIRAALRADLEWICTHADAVVTLPGSEASLGARAEMATAAAIGIPVYSLENPFFDSAETVPA